MKSHTLKCTKIITSRYTSRTVQKQTSKNGMRGRTRLYTLHKMCLRRKVYYYEKRWFGFTGSQNLWSKNGIIYACLRKTASTELSTQIWKAQIKNTEVVLNIKFTKSILLQWKVFPSYVSHYAQFFMQGRQLSLLLFL